ncbi:MAG: hypothetical protein QOD99_347 [Chthoniobacter sp.]|nr:hypothetical protein [Chthoniobacter sp.]
MIELLESRIAPASLILTDLDGDKVTFSASAGALDGLVTKTNARGDLHSVFSIDITAALFDGTDLTVSVKRGAGGDGLAIVGNINAGTNNLGSVKIAGDLGDIDAGSGASPVVLAIKSLKVQSFGRFYERAGADGFSEIKGNAGSLAVKGDFIDTDFYVYGDLASASVGGSVIGGMATGDGQIYAKGNVGKITIKKDLIGGGGTSTGLVGAGLDLGTVTIGGSIFGGKGDDSGKILAGYEGAATITKVTVGGSVVGGAGVNSGYIGNKFVGHLDNHVNLLSVAIGGDLTGGIGDSSGSIFVTDDVTKVAIKKHLTGGDGRLSGAVVAGGNLGSATVGGSIYGGKGINSGAIIAGYELTPSTITLVKVTGSVVGGLGDYSGLIGSRNPNENNAGVDVVAVSIGGELIGGFGYGSGLVDATGELGTVVIKKHLRGGSGYLSGAVTAGLTIDSVAIGGSIFGAAGQQSGSISLLQSNVAPRGEIHKIVVRGSVIGGGDFHSGSIFANTYGNGLNNPTLNLGSVTIGKDLVGGDGPSSGQIEVNNYDSPDFGKLDTLTIKGSVIGGSGADSGGVSAGGDVGSVAIGKRLIGRTGSSSGRLSAAHFVAITIGGSIQGGESLSAGSIAASGSGTSIGLLKIKHDVLGNIGTASGSVTLGGVIGTLVVGGDIIPGPGTNSGTIA